MRPGPGAPCRALASAFACLRGGWWRVTALPGAMVRLGLVLLSLRGGCASNPNAIWYEGSVMGFDVLIVGERQYKIVASGAGFHDRDEVERGFLMRAAHVCGGQEFTHEFHTEPYQYRSSGGGYSFTHDAFRTTGIVQCKWNGACVAASRGCC